MEPILSIAANILDRVFYQEAAWRLSYCDHPLNTYKRLVKCVTILFALAFMSVSEMNAQTCIILRKERGYIVIGADSLSIHTISFTDKMGKQHITSKTVYDACKIRQFKDKFFAQSGYAVTLDVFGLAEQAAKQGKTVSEAAAIYTNLTKSTLAKDWEAVRETMPDIYRSQIAEGTPFEAVFFGMERGSPTIAALVYKIVSPPNQKVVINCQIPECIQLFQENPSTLFMGRNDEILKVDGDPDFWNANQADGGIRRLIKMEMAAQPNFVGGNIDMLYIGSAKSYWIERGPECPDIKPVVNQPPNDDGARKPK